MWLLNESISSKAIVFKIRKQLNPSHSITTQSAVADPLHCTKRQEMNELHTHDRSSQYLLEWDPAQKQRHVQAELSLNLSVTNTKTQEKIPGISECRKDPSLTKGWQCCHSISSGSFHDIPAEPEIRAAAVVLQKSDISWLGAGSIRTVSDLNNASHSWSSYVHLKANKRETGYCSEINTLCFANYWEFDINKKATQCEKK